MYKERIWVEPDGRLPTVGLGRSLGRPHPQRQQIPEIDNVDDNAAAAAAEAEAATAARGLPCPHGREAWAASILEEGSPRRLPAYYQNPEKSKSYRVKMVDATRFC